MITGLDSKGNIYFSLVQSNSNSKIIELFYTHLVKKLDNEKPNWTKNLIVLQDNAAYHTSKVALKMLEKLGIPMCYSGPHSYDVCPIELLFASFKSVDVNPRLVATGK